jgi:RNA polymerase sigma-70 factor (ECF subfamily)
VGENILKRVAAGEAAAVDDCLRQYSGLVWSLARRFSSDHAESEDAVQDVFIDVWRSAGRYDPDVGSEATFITMIARRRLVDRHRKRTRQVETASLAEETVTGGFSAEREVDIADDAARAREALAQLRAEERQVLEMSIYQGLSQSKISKAIDMPLGPVKTHARRGLNRLRKMLSEESYVATE